MQRAREAVAFGRVRSIGRPLLTWTIRQALASRYAAAGRLHVLVSTDDPAIAETARAAGADMLDRPAALAQDDTPTEPAVVVQQRDQVAARAEEGGDLLGGGARPSPPAS